MVDGPAELRTFSYDASFLTQLSPRAPDVAVIAGTVEDVQALVRYAAERGIPVTPRGAATGQTGGAVNRVSGRISFAAYLGNTLRYDVDLGQGVLFKTDVKDPWHHELLPLGSQVSLSCPVTGTLAIPAD